MVNGNRSPDLQLRSCSSSPCWSPGKTPLMKRVLLTPACQVEATVVSQLQMDQAALQTGFSLPLLTWAERRGARAATVTGARAHRDSQRGCRMGGVVEGGRGRSRQLPPPGLDGKCGLGQPEPSVPLRMASGKDGGCQQPFGDLGIFMIFAVFLLCYVQGQQQGRRSHLQLRQ